MSYQMIKVRFEAPVCYLQLHRPEANNTINQQMVEECHQVLERCEELMTIVVLQGLPNMFCDGADFKGMLQNTVSEHKPQKTAEPLYDLWLKLASGSFVTIAHVQGKANAGGIGFVAACDIVVADQAAQFSLSELIFGIFPACVLPFLTRRIGFQKAHYLTLTSQTISAQQALDWGLVDVFALQTDIVIRKQLQRLRRLSKNRIADYKRYMNDLHDSIQQSKSIALSANQAVFSDPKILQGINQFVEKGRFPWEL